MPEGDFGINFVDVDKWYAMRKDGETVVVLHDPSPYIITPHVAKPWKIVQRKKLRGWDSFKEITQIEAETLWEVAEVPTISINDFDDWESETYPTVTPPRAWWKKVLNMS